MSKVLKQIERQIKRDGEMPEHLEVLKLYRLMIANDLSSSLLWDLLTTCSFDKDYNRTYAVRSGFSQLVADYFV